MTTVEQRRAWVLTKVVAGELTAAEAGSQGFHPMPVLDQFISIMGRQRWRALPVDL